MPKRKTTPFNLREKDSRGWAGSAAPARARARNVNYPAAVSATGQLVRGTPRLKLMQKSPHLVNNDLAVCPACHTNLALPQFTTLRELFTFCLPAFDGCTFPRFAS
jgi:hypothetical protein